MRAHRARDPEFATAIATAEAQAEALYHSKVLRGADRHWNAAAWMLERRWGERWGKRDPVAEVNLNVEKIQTTGPILPKDQQLAGYLNSLMTAAATLGILSNAADQSDTSGT